MHVAALPVFLGFVVFVVFLFYRACRNLYFFFMYYCFFGQGAFGLSRNVLVFRAYCLMA